MNQVRERSPIIGVKLANNRSPLRIEDVKHGHTAHLSKKRVKQKKTKEQLEKLNQHVQQLQYEISKHKQAEERLKHKVTELTATNEQLRQNTTVSNHLEQVSKQQIIEVSPVKEQPSPELTDSNTVKPHTKQQAGESKATQKSYNRRINISKQPDRISQEKTEHIKLSKELREQPLDVEKLKAIADLAKRIQNRPHKSS